jgi:hypothetical protein
MMEKDENGVKMNSNTIVYCILCYLIVFTMRLQGQVEAKRVKNAIVIIVVIVHDCRIKRVGVEQNGENRLDEQQ